ncbi:hypothetical protein BDZ94DRAFT_1326638 [Collybia nuda]|uniref:PIPK domain-containing protein n=1 Tax=Collybia nuda TaxID=64659 RepID=A0A9P5XWD2_9AGAR|nr:hypothetical protein BDZ94DRAFT_1326638 [Collybia nuda]
MVDNKPLPPVPINLTTLTIDARAHRARLIRHLLSEACDPGLESRREGWAAVLEEALDELGRRVSKDDWLNGIRKARQARRVTRQRQKGFGETAKLQDAAQAKNAKRQGDEGVESIEPSKDGSFEVLPAVENPRQSLSKPTQLKNERHVLLCVTPLGSRLPVPSEDSGFDLVPANIGCTFASGTFSLQDTEYESNTILYGNSQWIIPTSDQGIKVIGGTFTFKGVNSVVQHQILFKVLRISIYIHLSLVLEQHLLSDANVPLLFPRPKFPSPSTSAPGRPSMERTTSADTKTKKHNSFLPSSILSFFTNNMSHRSSTIMPILGRGGSLDLGIPATRQPRQEERTPRSSIEAGVGRLRRFSIMGDRRPSLRSSAGSSSDTRTSFSDILKHIQDGAGLMSTSPGVSFSPPTLIVDLAEKEQAKPSRRLKGDEKYGLGSLLGWEGKDPRTGMSGTRGFLQQQGLSVLCSSHVPRIPNETDKVPTTLAPLSTDAGKAILFAVCERPTWRTYQYYSDDPNGDGTLGETIVDFAARADNPCDQPGCTYKHHQHELRLIHDGILVTIKVTKFGADKPSLEDNRIDVWESCGLCDSESKRHEMSDGTYLLSFGKFLELLVYSPALCSSNPTLCEHTIPPPRPWPSMPTSRLNIVRHFSLLAHTVSFSLSTVEYIFELRVPRLQITRGNGDKSSKESVASEPKNTPDIDEDKKELRREIKRWWEGVTDHLDKLEVLLSDESSGFHKALPRLPSSDDAYDDIEVMSEPPRTPRADPSLIGLPVLPLSAPVTPPSRYLSDGYFPNTPTVIPGPPPSTPLETPTNQPANRLSSMRHTFQRTEQTLYGQLSRTPAAELNDVRRSFLYAAKGAHKRLEAWQKKHLKSHSRAPQKLAAEEPEWWGKGCHAVPGGNVVVREDDWGSIISFTLSTTDYQRELANMSTQRSPSQPITLEPSPVLSGQSSFFSAAVGYRLFTSSTHTQPDPDREDVAWSEPEAFSSVISRKEHPRDPTNILSIREVLRQKSPVEGAIPTASRFGSFGPAGSKNIVPPSAWAKPDVQISMDAADGEVSTIPDTMESAGKILQEIESVTESSRSSSRAPSLLASSNIVESHIRRGDSSSIISVESTSTIGRGQGSTIKSNMPPPPPPKDPPQEEKSENLYSQSAAHTTTSSFAGTLASGINSAMRFMLNGGETPRPTSPYGKSHHGLLLADVASIDERPHIKYDWTIGKRLKFSCTVYYAKQFDILRRRCGISDVFLKSLSRSTNWAADGGKSKSNFWKTSDDRFIIKTLVDAWNVADLQVLIEMAPSYFRYMDATTSKATVLAKMLGFYTIEIRNLETGSVQSKSDLLVMENLFYDQKVVKTFDLKGIQGRKVKTRGGLREPQRSKTLFDGEWIEGQQKTLMLVRPHSKQILQAAIKSDAEYLSRSNIMDYSLLVGVDEERKQIACGLVDTIGSYTFAKTLEYKAKHGLHAGKDITVIPPAEYQERFVSALEGYFLACPDKWSKPPDESKVLNDVSQLPSVL